MDRQRALACSRAEAQRLAGQPLSEVTPSRRDFTQYVATQKQEIALIARLSATRPRTTPELVAQARACDDAEVAALAVAASADELTIDDLAAIAAATSAPILRDTWIVDPSQLYYSRLYGADAALFPAAALAGDLLRELITVASSLHMASIVEVTTETDIDGALRLPRAILGLRCESSDGRLDVERTRQLAQRVPRQCTLIALPEVSSDVECAALRGLCDSVVVAAARWGAGA